jgi:hypothetical protein
MAVIKEKTGLALKSFMKEHFDFSTLKKVGFFSKGMKFNDYEGQAKRLCTFFGYKSIYEYGKHEIRCHISYTSDVPLLSVDEKGELKSKPFVTVAFPNSLHI